MSNSVGAVGWWCFCNSEVSSIRCLSANSTRSRSHLDCHLQAGLISCSPPDYSPKNAWATHLPSHRQRPVPKIVPDDSENGDPALYDIYLSAASRLRRRHTVSSLGQRSTTRKLYSDGARRRRGSTLPRSYRRHRRLRLWHTIPRRLAHYCMLSTRMTRSMRSSLGNTQSTA